MTETKFERITLSLRRGEYAYLYAYFPMDEHQWTVLMTTLNAMKPGLVLPPAPDSILTED